MPLVHSSEQKGRRCTQKSGGGFNFLHLGTQLALSLVLKHQECRVVPLTSISDSAHRVSLEGFIGEI